MKRPLEFIGVRPDEAPAVSLLSLYSLFVGLGAVAFSTGAYALFLAEFDATVLPYTYLGVAVAAPLLGLAFAKLRRYSPFPRVLRINTSSLVVVTTAVFLALTAGRPPWLVFLLPILVEVQLASHSLGFWPMASRLFDVRQSKRLFPLLDVGLRIGLVVGGVAIAWNIELLGLRGCFGIAAVCYGVALVVQFRITRRFREPLLADDDTGPKARSRIRDLLRQRYVLLLITFAALPSIAYNLVDYLFLKGVQVRMPAEAEIAAFVAYFRAATSAVMAFCMLFVGGRLLSRFGVQLGILIKPVLMLATVGATIGLRQAGSAFEVVFWLLVAMKLLDVSLRFIFEIPSSQILKLPLGPQQLMNANVVIESVVRPVANGIGGLILLGVANAVTGTLWLLAGVLLVWTLVSLLLRGGYRTALQSALLRRSMAETSFSLEDAQTVEIIKGKLASDRDGEVVYALHLLEKSGYRDLPTEISRLLDHPSEPVRTAALDAAARTSAVEARDAILACARTDPASRARRHAVRALAALDDRHAVAAFLEDPDLRVRAEAIRHLLHRGDDRAVAPLDAMRRSPRIEERAAAARVIARVGGPRFERVVEEMLKDKAPGVHRAVLAAAAAVDSPAAWQAVVDALEQPGMSAAAVSAIGHAGAAALPRVQASLADCSMPKARRLVRACAQIRGDQAVALLVGLLEHRDGEVRRCVLTALRVCGFAAHEDKREQVAGLAERELDSAERAQHAAGDLGSDPAFAELVDGLRVESRQAIHRAFGLLKFLYDQELIDRVETGITGDEPKRRAFAEELLETTFGKKAQRVIRVASGAAVDDAPGRDRNEIVAALARHPAAWIRAVALRAAGRAGIELDREMLAEASRDENPLVAEAAHALLKGESDMMPLVERVIFLRSMDLFAETSDELLMEIAPLLEEVDFEAGETINESGKKSNALYLVVSGEAKGIRTEDNKVLRTWSEGESIGEVLTLAEVPIAARVVSTGPSHMLKLDAASMRDLIATHGDLARALTRRLAGYIVELLEM